MMKSVSSVVLLLAAMCLSSLKVNAQQPSPKIGDAAPALNLNKILQTNETTAADLNGLKGNVVVLEFWATWCVPCIPALKHFNQLSEKFKTKPVRFIAITDEDEATIARFMKTVPINVPVGLDNNGATIGTYQVIGRPHTVVIDRSGRIAAITKPEAVTETVLNDLLADKKIDLPLKTAIGEDLEWDKTDPPDGIKPLTQIIIKPSYATTGGTMHQRGHISADGAYLMPLISTAYQISPVRIINNLPKSHPESNKPYRVSAIAPPGREDTIYPLFQQFLAATFRLDIKREMRERDVFILTVPDNKKGFLQPSKSTESLGMSARGKIIYRKQKIKILAEALEGILQLPVIDQTGLIEEYDWELPYSRVDQNVLIDAVREKLGLELARKKMPIEMLIVGNASPNK